jgi:hypothetical protein
VVAQLTHQIREKNYKLLFEHDGEPGISTTGQEAPEGDGGHIASPAPSESGEDGASSGDEP